MKRLLLPIILLAASASASTPIIRNQDGTVSINTTTLETVQGCFGPTPLIIHLDKEDRVSKIETLPNSETPEYWQLVVNKLSKAWNGVPADKVTSTEVDAVSGATYSSEGFISNVHAGITYYLSLPR